MAKKLKILHFSDIQFGRNHRFGQLVHEDNSVSEIKTLFDRLDKEFKWMKDDDIIPDMLVISGDLAETGAKSEFANAHEFISLLCERINLPKDRVIIIPGNHDINRKHCESYFSECEGDEVDTTFPYFAKWKNYRSFFEEFYKETRGISFSEETPWSFYQIEQLNVVVAGLNSTMAETHRDGEHYGHVGENQLNWFSEKLHEYEKKHWFRLGVVHHNVLRESIEDDENLRDSDDFRRILGSRLNMVLHGHRHIGDIGWLSQYVPIVSTGSAALGAKQRPEEIGNQYQILVIKNDGFERLLRRYDPRSKQWIGDTRSSPDGKDWKLGELVAFKSAKLALGNIEETVISESEDNPAIVKIDQPISEEKSLQRLANIPRSRLSENIRHSAVRLDEQERFVNILSQNSTVFLVADWALGKEGFLGCCITRMADQLIDNVYRLNCGSVASCEDIFNTAETQFGLSFQEFLASVSILKSALLILDDLPQPLTHGDERIELDRRLKSILDFCPNAKVVLCARHLTAVGDQELVVRLRPLDQLEIKLYIQQQDNTDPRVFELEWIERIYDWSGGLPVHLDRLLERLTVLDLQDILQADESHCPPNTATEPVPDSLVQAIHKLVHADNEETKNSFKLLKVLTVLRDGETFETIRRFFSDKPFYISNIDQLLDLSLIESIPITQTVPNFERNPDGSTQKLIRVPRQIRDYINTLLTDADKDDIMWASMSFFFGPQWWKNVRLRTSIFNAYSYTGIVGPGNEHVIIRMVINRAFLRRDYKKACKYAHVFLSYCRKLLERDRFRDVAIAAESVVGIFEDLPDKLIHCQALYMYGRSLHMTHQLSKAIFNLEKALAVNEVENVLNDDFRSDILIVLALCYQGSDRPTDAITAANKVLEISHRESHNSFQANALIANQTLIGGKLVERLKELECESRNKGKKVVADNIAINLSKITKEVNESIHYLQRVLNSGGDVYNRVRAVIEKAEVLGQHKRLSELYEIDRRYLTQAYGYCYAQRFGTLLNRCHRVLWNTCKREGFIDYMFRMFRFSSFYWRLKGEETREHEYLQDLEVIDIQGENIEPREIKIELIYYNKRKSFFHKKS